MFSERERTEYRHRIIALLTAARIEKGISQQSLASMIGTQRSNICRIESGAQNISLDTLLKIADALGKEITIDVKERSGAQRELEPSVLS